MMVYEICTRMEKKDYHKFLYIATLGRNKFIIPLLAGISLMGALFCGFDGAGVNPVRICLFWIFFMILVFGTVCVKVEMANKRRVKTDRTGVFESQSRLLFYEDRIHMENPAMKAVWEIEYDKFHSLLESREYFIFYLTVNQASLIRKKDVTDVEEFRSFLKATFGKRYDRTWM